MTCILGIDPGSRVTGFGVINKGDRSCAYISSGCIRATRETFYERLRIIYQGIQKIVDQYQPDVVCIEKVFMAKNADSALKLGQARGAAIVAAQDVKVFEYTPTQVKYTVTGIGRADKDLVRSMVMKYLNLNDKPQMDASDALAIALCHVKSNQMLQRINASSSNRRRHIRL